MRGNRSTVSLIDGHIDEVNVCICCHKVEVPVGKHFCKQCAEEILAIIDKNLEEREDAKTNC